MADAAPPVDPIAFIQRCLSGGRVRWTYHVRMRMRQRRLSAEMLMQAACTLTIIEAYPKDKYLPSFLLRGRAQGLTFHALVAIDVPDDNIRVVTMYRPAPSEWNDDHSQRRSS